MGTDHLGRDVLSRFLEGGRTILIVSLVGLALSYVVAIPLGLISGYRGRLFDLFSQRGSEILVAFPPLVALLILFTGLGNHVWVVVVGIILVTAPRVALIVRAATREVRVSGYVERAEARGEGVPAIVFREILPNIWTPILADFGTRLAATVAFIAGLTFLGFGPAPPAADWGVMVSENRAVMTVQPWAVVFPVLILVVLTLSLTLVGDSLSRGAARISDVKDRTT
jgi:peptide/nickel transport system permease protein